MIWEGIIGLCNSKTAIKNELTPEPVFGGDLRLYPVKLPQGLKVFPAVAGKIVTTNPTRSFDGDEGLDSVPYDLHSYGKTKKEAEDTAKLLRNELEGSSGTFNGITFEDVQFAPSGSDDYLEKLELYTYSIEVEFDVRN